MVGDCSWDVPPFMAQTYVKVSCIFFEIVDIKVFHTRRHCYFIYELRTPFATIAVLLVHARPTSHAINMSRDAVDCLNFHVQATHLRHNFNQTANEACPSLFCIISEVVKQDDFLCASRSRHNNIKRMSAEVLLDILELVLEEISKLFI
jgi:hypothetical protein